MPTSFFPIPLLEWNNLAKALVCVLYPRMAFFLSSLFPWSSLG